MPRDGQLTYVCAVPCQVGFGCCVGSITSQARVGLTTVNVDSGTLRIGVKPLLFDGLNASDDTPCEWVGERESTAPDVVVDQGGERLESHQLSALHALHSPIFEATCPELPSHSLR